MIFSLFQASSSVLIFICFYQQHLQLVSNSNHSIMKLLYTVNFDLSYFSHPIKVKQLIVVAAHPQNAIPRGDAPGRRGVAWSVASETALRPADSTTAC